MESLIARGSIDLGNVYLARGNYSDAERYFEQGLEAAGRYGAQQNEARARLSLASLYVQRGESDRGLAFDQQALAFYQSGGYRTETSQALLLRGRAFRQKGNYDAALQAFEEQLKLAEQTGDQAQIAYAHGSIGTLLFDQEKYAEALQHFEDGRERYKTLGNQLYTGYALMNVGTTLWSLGHYDQARQMLDEASAIARQKGSSFTALQAEIGFVEAEMSLNENVLLTPLRKVSRPWIWRALKISLALIQGVLRTSPVSFRSSSGRPAIVPGSQRSRSLARRSLVARTSPSRARRRSTSCRRL